MSTLKFWCSGRTIPSFRMMYGVFDDTPYQLVTYHLTLFRSWAVFFHDGSVRPLQTTPSDIHSFSHQLFSGEVSGGNSANSKYLTVLWQSHVVPLAPH